jgi:hypothetical protein
MTPEQRQKMSELNATLEQIIKKLKESLCT